MWKLDACVKARVLVDLVCLMTTLKECARSFSEVPASHWVEQAGNWTLPKITGTVAAANGVGFVRVR